MDDRPPIWESVLALDWYNIIVWIWDHLPFEVKSYVWMIILTVAFVLFMCFCCCAVCFLSPCCVCAIWYKKRRDSRNRAAGERTIPQPASAYPTAPPLLYKV